MTVDTLRADFLGAYGFAAETSPHLDALARESVVFERALAASSRTAPSHASILTSRWVRRHSVGWGNGSTRLSGIPTLAERFREAGYETAAFVGNVTLKKRVGLDAGFDLYDDELPDAEVNRRRIFERVAERTAARALAWLAREGEEPRFLWVHFQDPHGPYTPPPAHAGLELGDALPDRELPALAGNRGRHGIPAYQVLGDLRRLARYAERYAGEIRYFDAWLGRLLAGFDARPRPGVVLLTADHGESFGEEGWYLSHGHRTSPDQAWVPFLLRAPGLEPGRHAEPVHHVDVMPTLLELAGLPAPEGIDGVALGPALREGRLPRRVLFTDVGTEVGAYRDRAFFRVRLPESGEAPSRPAVERFVWSAGTRPRPGAPDPGLEEALLAYARLRPETLPAGPLDLRSLERLEALGYVEPGTAEAQRDAER